MFTGTYDAYKLGQEMLDGDDSDSKVVVVLSDGQTSNCKGDIEIGYDPSIDKKEFEIAKKWRENGIKIIFVRVGDDQYAENIKEIVGNDNTSILSVHDYSKLDKSVITGVAKKICSEEHF
ncbi:hypothetical protein TELCIR_12398 [Teladorsagia circumcincta]|uniref:VWFA domain-containing protein n=1 Tax=Teladorsagia circumcincta TaxID=45464 RepID=A0A2G9U6K8_TELCI|nr:hypothetical protein TELCIR_12398 [Teladorsagia circumcincta]